MEIEMESVLVSGVDV